MNKELLETLDRIKANSEKRDAEFRAAFKNQENKSRVYNYFRHGLGIKVQCPDTLELGLVVTMRETSPECLDPVILWDGTTTPMLHTKGLFLAPEKE